MSINANNKKPLSPAAVLILLFLIFPPLAIVGAFGLMVFKLAKKYSQDGAPSDMGAREKLLRRMKEEDVAERPYKSHPHTPVSYSYDACARGKRLEQLKVLKGAGLLDEWEYQQRRQEILK